MALAVDATSGTSGSATSLTVSHTVSGTDRLLFVTYMAAQNSAGDTVTATYNGVSMAEVASHQNALANQLTVKIFRLIAPDTGTHDIVVNSSGSFAGSIGGISFTGGHQTTPESASVDADAVSSPATLDVSSASDEIVIDALLWNGTNAQTVGAGQTAFVDLSDGTRRAGSSYETGAATTTMSWTSANTVWTQTAVAVKPSAGGGGGGGTTPFRAPGVLVRRSSRNFAVN